MAVRGTIPKTMKALVAYGRGDYRFEPEYPTPECGPDDIIIKVEGLWCMRRRLEMPARRRNVLGRRDAAVMGKAAVYSGT